MLWKSWFCTPLVNGYFMLCKVSSHSTTGFIFPDGITKRGTGGEVKAKSWISSIRIVGDVWLLFCR
jgi:hypothetical protein